MLEKRSPYKFNSSQFKATLKLLGCSYPAAAKIIKKTTRSVYNLFSDPQRLTVREFLLITNATGLDPRDFLVEEETFSRTRSVRLVEKGSAS